MLPQRFLAVLVFLGVLGVSCGDPCVDLAKKICRCKPTEAEQSACTQTVDSSSRPKASAEQQGVCADRLDTCTCAKLEAGELDACGMSTEPPR
ncbi:MAG: hypothetical protein HY903_19345 [Deltaproteobacteria bacterium]|nr:hypothetical protein [Deltaproteobacteria bacterium]